MVQRSVDDEIQALREDLALLRSDVSDLSGTLRDLAGSRASGVSESVQQEIRETRDRLRQKIAQARHQGVRAVEEVEESIGSHPLASVATAVGVGFVLAKLMDLGSRR